MKKIFLLIALVFVMTSTAVMPVFAANEGDVKVIVDNEGVLTNADYAGLWADFDTGNPDAWQLSNKITDGILNGSKGLYVKDIREPDDATWGYGFFPYKDIGESWDAQYEGLVIRVKNPNDVPVFWGVVTTDTARVRFVTDGAIYYNLNGEKDSSAIEYFWFGDGVITDDIRDRGFTLPANFDGYVLLPFKNAYFDDAAVLQVPDVQFANFSFGVSPGYILGNIYLYKGSDESVLKTLGVEKPAAAPAANDEPALTSTSDTNEVSAPVSAPATGDYAIAFFLAAAISASLLVKRARKAK